ncbi:MAG TPA: ANTAR domain-containing protein [Ornithinimicrobium sp.]|nr:ANTAR domain-containing protein [Ornithinimicrobium sp.]
MTESAGVAVKRRHGEFDPAELPLAQEMANVVEAMTVASDLVSTAHIVAEAACSLIPGTQQASVSLARRGVGIDTIASHGQIPRQADAAQVDTGQGPCIEAAWQHRLARLPDTQTDRRWPQFSARARAMGVGSMLSLQLSLPQETEEDRIGAINCYSESAHSFGRDCETIGLFLAVHASAGIGAAEREEQLRHALNSRDVIGQAKGLIMAQQGLSADAAFALMVRQARDTNTRMHDLAVGVVSRHAS